jgi:hypothetical protein
MADAFSKCMMPTLIENRERGLMPCCTREQAARLMEELRAQYQMLSPEVRNTVRLTFSRLAVAQMSMEGEDS